jgi:hypothetical protein
MAELSKLERDFWVLGCNLGEDVFCARIAEEGVLHGGLCALPLTATTVNPSTRKPQFRTVEFCNLISSLLW